MKVLRPFILSLLVLLPSSSFWLNGHLEKEISAGNSSSNVILFAANKKLPTAITAKLALLETTPSAKLAYLNHLGLTSRDYALQLANYYLKQNNQPNYLKWLLQSAALKNDVAIDHLITHFYQLKHYNKALYWLTESEIKTDSQLVIHAKILLALGQTSKAITTADKLSSAKIKKQLNAQFNRFGVFEYSDKAPNSLSKLSGRIKQVVHSKPQCLKSVSMVATNLDDLNKMASFKQRLSQHSFSSYFCIDNITYMPITSLDCKHVNQAVIDCNETPWHKETSRFPTDYLAIMLPQGGANVHYGILYLDSADSFDVFTHELSHLLGFVDEYQVANSHKVCQMPHGAKGHNIALLPKRIPKLFQDSFGSLAHRKVRESLLDILPWGSLIENEHNILVDKGDFWQVGSASSGVSLNEQRASAQLKHTSQANFSNEPLTKDKSLGLYIAETCSQGQYAAFKPMNKATSLRHTDVVFPKEYHDILALSPEQFLMPMYYFNIAASHYRINQDEQGDYWLARAKQQQGSSKGH